MPGFFGIGKEADSRDDLAKLREAYEESVEMVVRQRDRLLAVLEGMRDQVLAMEIQFSAVQAENGRLRGECDGLRAERDRLLIMGERISKSLTLEEVVAILNDRRHEGYSDYCIFVANDDSIYVEGRNQCDEYEPFEATAIAEKYLRTPPDSASASP